SDPSTQQKFDLFNKAVTTFGVTIEIPHPRITTIVPATAAKKKVVKNAHPTTSNNPISSNIIFMIALQVRVMPLIS
ncbi:hypothetical protein, partial [Klebsiella pneumoniae]|uniref:hypothetical protein n=1 Tax=Klebsiella pneumoniae TaxID=573 RepID=UPI001E311E01